MPLYDAQCKVCNKTQEYFKTVANRDETPVCCENKTERVLLKGPIGFVDNPAFMSQYKKMY
jgi:hypothetical protein